MKGVVLYGKAVRPYCDSHKAWPDNDLATLRPELLEYWDWEKNNADGLDPRHLLTTSHEVAWWICGDEKCKGSYRRGVREQCRRSEYLCADCLRQRTRRSGGEQDLADYLSDSTDPIIIRRDRSVLSRREIDRYLPELNLGFEYNGMYWHSSIANAPRRESDYHADKFSECKTHGVDLIYVWERDWRADESNDRRLKTELRMVLDVASGESGLRSSLDGDTVSISVGESTVCFDLTRGYEAGSAAAWLLRRVDRLAEATSEPRERRLDKNLDSIDDDSPDSDVEAKAVVYDSGASWFSVERDPGATL